jgi:hypothetical protein
MVLEDFIAISGSGGGHVFNFTDTQPVSNNEIRNVGLVQNNAGKAVIYSVGSSEVFISNHIHDFTMQYAASSTVPAIDINTGANSSNLIENFTTTGSNTSAGTYAISITQQSNPVFGTIIRNGTIEVAGGGGIYCGGCWNTVIDNIVSYDLTINPANPFINMATASGGQVGRYNTLRGIYSRFGTSMVPDVYIADAVDTTKIEASDIQYLNNTGYVLIENSLVSNTGGGYAIVRGDNLQAGNALIAPNVEVTGAGAGIVTQVYQNTATSPTVTWGTATGTPAVTASSPLAINSTTGNISIPAQYQTITCEGGLGDGLNAIAAGTYLQSTCYNGTGVTITITGIKCYSTPGTSTLAAAGNTLGSIATAFNCSSGYASGTLVGTALTAGDYIKFTFVADGTTAQTDWVVTGTY